MLYDSKKLRHILENVYILRPIQLKIILENVLNDTPQLDNFSGNSSQ